jgi:cytosine/adenosine deaminase-related metal-dependent hydrolase
LTRYNASWVIPIAGRPISNGWVELDGDRISAHGSRRRAESANAIDLGRVAILPGLVNAHTHLELSHLRGRIPSGKPFVDWIRGLIAERSRRADADPDEMLSGVGAGIAEAVRCGTALIGDISNTLVTVDPLGRSELAAVVFYELIRFNTPEPGAFVRQALGRIQHLGTSAWVRVSLAAHAPYSVSPGLFVAIQEMLDRGLPISVHVAESPEEVEFIASGTGSFRAFLAEMDAWNPAWVPPGVSPVQYLDDHGFLGRRVLAVHGVQMTRHDLQRLADRGTTLVTCPRSNVRTGAGTPPLEDFYRSGVKVAVGTDSLASTPDLNVFAELGAMRQLAPRVPASTLLESATLQGARALGFDADYGTIEPGKRARLLAVAIPDGVDDVEEYLVSGVQHDRIRWIGERFDA